MARRAEGFVVWKERLTAAGVSVDVFLNGNRREVMKEDWKLNILHFVVVGEFVIMMVLRNFQ